MSPWASGSTLSTRSLHGYNLIGGELVEADVVLARVQTAPAVIDATSPPQLER